MKESLRYVPNGEIMWIPVSLIKDGGFKAFIVDSRLYYQDGGLLALFFCTFYYTSPQDNLKCSDLYSRRLYLIFSFVRCIKYVQCLLCRIDWRESFKGNFIHRLENEEQRFLVLLIILLQLIELLLSESTWICWFFETGLISTMSNSCWDPYSTFIWTIGYSSYH